MTTIIRLAKAKGLSDTALNVILTAIQKGAADSATTEPVAITISETCRISGLSRSQIYRDLAAGKLLAIKNGTSTLVLTESLKQLLASLPPAKFRAPNAGV
jgi:DNA-binding transcriptional regulator YdaS (Cro superfamily)